MSGGLWRCRAAAAAAALVSGLAGAAAAPPGAGDPVRGQALAREERCLECHLSEAHDPAREGTSSARFPKLGGQVPAYLVKQLQDFRSGARRHEFMTVLARALNEADLPDVAAYFGSLPPMRGEAAPVPAGSQALFLQGDPARGLMACAQCHGADGRSPQAGGSPVPVLAGQEQPYLASQLRDWQLGDRRNSPGQLMRQATQALSEAEISGLATYLSSQ